MGTEYWAPLLGFLKETMVAEGTIDNEDLDRFLITDSPQDAVAHVLRAATQRFGLVWKRRPLPSRFLGEAPMDAPREVRLDPEGLIGRPRRDARP
jgi:hypothetical protein